MLLKKAKTKLWSMFFLVVYEPFLTSCGQVFSMISMMVFLSLPKCSFFLVNVKIFWCCSCVIALVLGTKLIYLLVGYEADFSPPHPEASWFDQFRKFVIMVLKILPLSFSIFSSGLLNRSCFIVARFFFLHVYLLTRR